jgi:RimJ/RimL family protein N-acetyltransferase
MMFTDRLELRLPIEPDRARFVELFCDDEFMVHSSGVLDARSASARFDRMLERAAELPFAKQPIIVRATGEVVGYAGVDRFDFDGRSRLEFGWRLVLAARGNGYATEAAEALLALARSTFSGEILAMIDPVNRASRNVAEKLGFSFWKLAEVNGYLDNLFRITIG